MNTITAAASFLSAIGKLRKGIIAHASVNTAAYVFVVLTGAFMSQQFIASFECIPPFVILFAVSLFMCLKESTKLDPRLWVKGIWFNAKDLLHAGLILWIGYIVLFVAGKEEDRTD